MTKRIADLLCPECQKEIHVPFDVADPPTLDEIGDSLQELLKGHATSDEITRVFKQQIEALKPQEAEGHRHKTGDEFFDCPECLAWVGKTAQRYQIVPRTEPEAPEAKEPAFGSVFSRKKEGGES